MSWRQGDETSAMDLFTNCAISALWAEWPAPAEILPPFMTLLFISLPKAPEGAMKHLAQSQLASDSCFVKSAPQVGNDLIPAIRECRQVLAVFMQTELQPKAKHIAKWLGPVHQT